MNRVTPINKQINIQRMRKQSQNPKPELIGKPQKEVRHCSFGHIYFFSSNGLKLTNTKIKQVPTPKRDKCVLEKKQKVKIK